MIADFTGILSRVHRGDLVVALVQFTHLHGGGHALAVPPHFDGDGFVDFGLGDDPRQLAHFIHVAAGERQDDIAGLDLAFFRRLPSVTLATNAPDGPSIPRLSAISSVTG